MRTNKEVFCNFDNCQYNKNLTCENEEYEKCVHRLLEQSFLKVLRSNYGCKYCIHNNYGLECDMKECEDRFKFIIDIEETAKNINNL